MKQKKRVGGESRWCFCSLKVEKKTEWVEIKKRENDDTKVERRETASECIREGNYTADNLILLSAARRL